MLNMPELDVFLGSEEQRKIATHIISEGGALVPDLDYDTPEYQRLNSIEMFDQVKSSGASMFYVLLDIVSTSPLEMRFSKEKGKYYIMPRNGGPTIEFSCGAVFMKGGRQHIAQSFIAHYPTYWNTTLEINEKVPDELRQFYKQMSGFVKKWCHKISNKNRSYYVGTEIEKLRDEGGLLVGVDT